MTKKVKKRVHFFSLINTQNIFSFFNLTKKAFQSIWNLCYLAEVSIADSMPKIRFDETYWFCHRLSQQQHFFVP